jgi:hypothetical protein
MKPLITFDAFLNECIDDLALIEKAVMIQLVANTLPSSRCTATCRRPRSIGGSFPGPAAHPHEAAERGKSKGWSRGTPGIEVRM